MWGYMDHLIGTNGIVAVLLLIGVVALLVYATWWKYDSEEEWKEASEKVERLKEELEALEQKTEDLLRVRAAIKEELRALYAKRDAASAAHRKQDGPL